MRYTGPRNRIARKEGMDLGLKTIGSKSHASLLKKLNILPGQHGVRKRRKISERGHQLRETQKLRYMFGLTASQLKKYYKVSIKKTGNTGLLLSRLLERRLDAVVHRLGFSPTRASARQLVTHRHISVNGSIVNIPSYLLRVGDRIEFSRTRSRDIPDVQKSLGIKDLSLPSWIERAGAVGKLVLEPGSELIEKQINLRRVIEFFSR